MYVFGEKSSLNYCQPALIWSSSRTEKSVTEKSQVEFRVSMNL